MHWFLRAVLSLVAGVVLSVWLTGPGLASPKLLEAPHDRVFMSVYEVLKPKLAQGQQWKWRFAHGAAYTATAVPIGLVAFGVLTWRHRAKKPADVEATS